ncbi:DUF1931 domain-containing protein [Candidatus Woesearchaeota archaeon]|nr:DUF1931 domain-containing protein [Candidatus Woesearchaeota archaeon]
MTESIIIRSKLKDLVGEFNIAGDFADALNEKVKALIKEACIRAEANGRKTVMGRDL